MAAGYAPTEGGRSHVTAALRRATPSLFISTNLLPFTTYPSMLAVFLHKIKEERAREREQKQIYATNPLRFVFPPV